MYKHLDIEQQLGEMIRTSKITLGGNRLLKIYGMLNCTSGRRMKKENRVFFQSQAEAELLGYRPCGNCLKGEYRAWKMSKKRVEKGITAPDFCVSKTIIL